jgi:hypothetical protein
LRVANANAPNNKQPRGLDDADMAGGKKGTKRGDKKAASCI